MKHLIIFNEKAGSEKDAKAFVELVNKEFKGLDFEMHATTAPREAIAFLREYLKKNNKDVVRVYACGGDGTVHECANALVGFDNAELAIYPVGTGNDFAKTYAGTKDYKEVVENRAAEKRLCNFAELIKAEARPIDLSKISGDSLREPMYSINVINFGFDAIVGARGNYYKEHGIPANAPKKFQNDPYGYALKNDAMKHGRFNDTIVKADGEQLNEKQILLGTLAQGQYVGGSFWCAPKSDNTDGLIDVCVLKTMTFLGLGMIIGPYTKGKHLDKPRKKIVYRRAKKVEIIAPKEIDVCVDGEMIKGKEFTVECVPGAIKLAVF